MRKKLKSEMLMDANDVNDNKHKWMTIHHMVQLFFLLQISCWYINSTVLNLNPCIPHYIKPLYCECSFKSKVKMPLWFT